MRNHFRYGLAASGLSVGLVLFLAPRASGQAAYGTIIGTATDPSGAAVANAQVTATDTEKGVSQTTTTNDSGNYTLSNLTPGDYKVTNEPQGFKTHVQASLPVIGGSSTILN